MKKYGFTTAILALLVGVCVISPAWATKITVIDDLNGTETVLFYDNYEDDAATPYLHGDALNLDVVANDFDPAITDPMLTLTASWDVQEGSNPTAMQVTSNPSDSFAAFEGNNCFRAMRPAGFVYVLGNFAAQTSGTIHFETMYNSTAGGFFGLRSGSTLVTHNYFIDDDQIPAGYGRPFTTGYGDTRLLYEFGTWAKIEIDYTIGEKTYDLTCNGVTLEGIDTWDEIAASSVDNIRIGGAANSITAFDATTVPEPSTVVLILCGIAGLFFVRRR